MGTWEHGNMAIRMENGAAKGPGEGGEEGGDGAGMGRGFNLPNPGKRTRTSALVETPLNKEPPLPPIQQQKEKGRRRHALFVYDIYRHSTPLTC